MFLKTFVYQFQGYLTDYRKILLKNRYGLASLRNILFVKLDKKLYFIDNAQTEVCLSHPDFSQLQNVPEWQEGVDTWEELQNKPLVFPPESHTHPAPDWYDLTNVPVSFPPESHNHDDRYYTEAETDTALADKAEADHTHPSPGTVLTSPADTIPDHLLAKIAGGGDISLTETEVGPGYKQLEIGAGENLLRRTSANRPGPTKLYRRDSDSNYSIQNHWTGSHWWLRGYDGADTFHAECRVGYADSLTLGFRGIHVYRAADYTGVANAWTPVYFNSTQVARQNNGPYFDNSTAIYAVRTGWHIVSFAILLYPNTTSPDLLGLISINGGLNYQDGYVRVSDVSNANYKTLALSRPVHLTAGQYVQVLYYAVTTAPTIKGLYSSFSVVEMI